MTESWISIQNRPVKEMKKLKLHLAASNRIAKDSGLTMISITGKQQSGKSSYAMLILDELFNHDKEEVLKHIVFSMDDFAKLISGALNGGYRERCILWDDASVQGSAARWTTDPKLVMYLAGLGDTLGVATKGLIMTSPSGDMTKAFRNYAKYKVVISNGHGNKYTRIARGYWIGRSPMDQRYCQSEFEDKYESFVPYYEEYAQRRKEISLNAVKSLESFLGGGTEETNGVEKPKRKTIKDKVTELHRDFLAGVFGETTFKQVCRDNKINYNTALNYV